MENKNIAVPISIILVALLIGGGIYYGKGPNKPTTTNNIATTTINTAAIGPLGNVRQITPEDHLRGNLSAPVKIVEFSDLECPFCKRFHQTMLTIEKEYVATGKIAWVYRQFPLEQLHPKAPKEAEATECVAELGGNDKFWQYLDKIFAITPSNNGLDLALLPKIAKDLGLDVKSFEACLASNKYASKVQADIAEASSAGGQGTPFAVIISETPIKGDLSKYEQNGYIEVSPDRTRVALKGALPLDAVRNILNAVLAK
jgi:protein-disulfide isomerase